MLKETIKFVLKKIPIAFTQNQRYDRYTKRIILKHCKQHSNCIDVGCHKGEVLDIMLQAAPKGKHFGFEPIPDLFEALKKKDRNSNISPIALSNTKGSTEFNYVISNPSYSGIKKRSYDRKNELDTKIEVQTDLMDHVIPSNIKIDLIKIDVEGAEMLVLEGAQKILKRDHPIIIFEHGLGASEYYEGHPDKSFSFFEKCGYNIFLLADWLQERAPLTKSNFKDHYFNRSHYYFVAAAI